MSAVPVDVDTVAKLSQKFVKVFNFTGNPVLRGHSRGHTKTGYIRQVVP